MPPEPAINAIVILVLSFLVPPVVSFLKSNHDRPILNTLIAIGVAFVAAALSLFLDGGLEAVTDGPRLLAALGAVFTLAHVVYRTYFVATPLNERLERAIWGPRAPGASD
ncbi:MAG: hypothetical protein E6Q97_08155 [Desulfurellales bacterium]|nr:MAG: hypothetical protein E6Q97_08155 [Desulfurellales bacterium]